MNLTDIRIAKRLVGGFGVLLFLMIMMIVVGLTQLAQVGRTAKVMTEEEIVKERLTDDLVSNAKQNGIRTLAALKSNDPAMLEMYKKQIKETAAINQEITDKLEKMLKRPRGKAIFAEALERQKNFRKIRDELLTMKANGVDMEILNEKISSEFMPARTAYFETMNVFEEFERGVINEAGAEIQSVKETSVHVMLSFGLVGIVLGVFMSLKLSNSITKPLKEAVALAKAVAEGDLTSHINISSKDEIGELLSALKSMNENLARVVGEVRNSAESIATASSEIATGNLDLSSRTEEQASSLEETASAMEQLTSTVRGNADNSSQASLMAGSASNVAKQGGKAVEEIIATMTKINESSKLIAEIIGVIDGIAFQTNILSLNAAVEAARAGEQGRGFAVVASEVRILAHRTTQAAKEIKSLITDSVSRVETGSHQVTQAGLTMGEIVESVARVTTIIEAITSASHEQSTGIEQVNQAIMQMDEVTQQNAALVEEAAAASQALQHQAALLAQAVSVFKINNALVVV